MCNITIKSNHVTRVKCDHTLVYVNLHKLINQMITITDDYNSQWSLFKNVLRFGPQKIDNKKLFITLTVF